MSTGYSVNNNSIEPSTPRPGSSPKVILKKDCKKICRQVIKNDRISVHHMTNKHVVNAVKTFNEAQMLGNDLNSNESSILIDGLNKNLIRIEIIDRTNEIKEINEMILEISKQTNINHFELEKLEKKKKCVESEPFFAIHPYSIRLYDDVLKPLTIQSKEKKISILMQKISKDLIEFLTEFDKINNRKKFVQKLLDQSR
jgi:hypothetical protein